jgi:hypothetical protein
MVNKRTSYFPSPHTGLGKSIQSMLMDRGNTTSTMCIESSFSARDILNGVGGGLAAWNPRNVTIQPARLTRLVCILNRTG